MIEDGVKITELEEASSVTGTDIVPIVNDTETKSATINQIASYTNSLNPPELCLVTVAGSKTAGSDYYIPLDTMTKRYGPSGNFTISDGGIKIGPNIHHVKVWGNVFVQDFPVGTSYVWGRIYQKRGSSGGVASGSINGSNCSFLSTPIPPTIVDTQENDVFKLIADCSGGGTVRGYVDNTWLCIEKID